MRKRLLLLLMHVFPVLIYSQTYTDYIDDKFQLLNKSYVTTDILYDRVFNMSDLPSFNQTSTDNSSVHHFYRLMLNYKFLII